MSVSHYLPENWIDEIEPAEETQYSTGWLSQYALPYRANINVEQLPASILVRFVFRHSDDPTPEHQLDNIEMPNVYVVTSQTVHRVEQVRIVGSDDPAILPSIANRLDAAAESIKHLGEKLSHKLVAEILRRLPELEQMQNNSC